MDKRTKAYKQMMKLGVEQPAQAVQPPKPLYKVTLKINDTEYVGEAETVEDALSQINPPFFKSLSYLTIEKGDKKVELKLGTFACKRLFTSETVRKIKSDMYSKLFL